MRSIYDDPVWGYDDEVPFVPRDYAGGSGRSEEQKEIDAKQDKEIKDEIERSTGVDSEQSSQIDELSKKVEEGRYYETDENNA